MSRCAKSGAMLERLRLIDFKSFVDEEAEFAPLTLLVGANASGKSNVLDALRFLQQTVLDMSFSEFLRARSALEWKGGRVCAVAHAKPREWAPPFLRFKPRGDFPFLTAHRLKAQSRELYAKSKYSLPIELPVERFQARRLKGKASALVARKAICFERVPNTARKSRQTGPPAAPR